MSFISEIHYQNGYAGSSGVGEFVEVTLSPTEFARAADFDLTTYQTDGTVRETFNLGDLTPVLDPDTGFYVYTMTTRVTAPDHLSGANEAEAVALTDSTLPDPVTFIDIGGGISDITAIEGPASGATSGNIAASSGGQSIQFDYYGNRIDATLDSDSSVVCLTQNSLIDTPNGVRPIQDLEIGDMVETLTRGAQEIRMIYARTLDAAALVNNPKLMPICIRRDALGKDQPNQDLHVSPQHRMLLSGVKYAMLFGEVEVLVKAKMIAEYSDGAFVDRRFAPVTYYHILFDQHEIIRANGCPTESFYPGKEALKSLDPEERQELFTLFPELQIDLENYPPEDHTTLRRWEVARAMTA